MPAGKGIMGHWAHLAARAAFRKGNASYCGYINAVEPGMWAGGMVGLKSILGVKSRTVALKTLDELSQLGYVSYSLDEKTKKLSYQLNDWVAKCNGAECRDGAVYATDGYGFLCLPRNITERLVQENRIFSEADAWLDLWCHTIFEDPGNAFSYLVPVIQYGKYGAVLTLETLGQRWNWEKTKVWRFFKKHGEVFSLQRLPGSYGCVILNVVYPTGKEISQPTQDDIMSILDEIRISSKNVHVNGTDNERINRLIAWYSKKIISKYVSVDVPEQESRVAHSTPIIRAYLSQCRNCENCIYDCKSIYITTIQVLGNIQQIRGPCLVKQERQENDHERERFKSTTG